MINDINNLEKIMGQATLVETAVPEETCKVCAQWTKMNMVMLSLTENEHYRKFGTFSLACKLQIFCEDACDM